LFFSFVRSERHKNWLLSSLSYLGSAEGVGGWRLPETIHFFNGKETDIMEEFEEYEGRSIAGSITFIVIVSFVQLGSYS